ncbi:MAG: AzlC family ABC transporter permease [Eubacterium sp.]|nr:AzlC family ABC transporter permease [Eubacterium sp.]
MEHSNRKAYCAGLKSGIPIGLGYLAVAFTLGIQAKRVGITALQSALVSFGLHASAGEYIAFSLYGAGAGILIMVLMEVVANARYLLMSCALSQKIPEDTPLWKRLIIGYFITDEIFGAAISVSGKLNPYYVFGMASVASPGWVFGTALGVILGNRLPGNIVSALSVGLYGMFLACIIPEGKKNRVVANVIVVSFLLSYCSTVIPGVKDVSSGIKIIVLTVLIAGIFTVFRPINEIEENDD